MTYNFRPRKKNLATQIPFGWWIFSVIIFLIVIIFYKSFFRLLTPVQDTPESLLAIVIDRATPKHILLQRQQLLEQENRALRDSMIGNELLQEENNSLRTLLDYPVIAPQVITARVISKPSQSVYNRIIIDRGGKDGVAIGDKVIAGEYGYIATLDQVSENTASGTFLSSHFFKGHAVIARLGITVPVEGKGSGNFELHVPRDLDVRDGDIMTLPGSPDIVFGIIKSIQFDERDPYQTVLARTPVNVQELKFVRVMK